MRIMSRESSNMVYYRAAKKREERRGANRLDSLFLLIEKQEGIKQLSCR